MIVHALLMREFGGYDFVNGNTLRDDEDIQSTSKQKAPKLILFLLLFTQMIKTSSMFSAFY
jgi:mannosyltransferase OCH1-like enzyme